VRRFASSSLSSTTSNRMGESIGIMDVRCNTLVSRQAIRRVAACADARQPLRNGTARARPNRSRPLKILQNNPVQSTLGRY
jgi:hypothetical protein